MQALREGLFQGPMHLPQHRLDTVVFDERLLSPYPRGVVNERGIRPDTHEHRVVDDASNVVYVSRGSAASRLS